MFRDFEWRPGRENKNASHFCGQRMQNKLKHRKGEEIALSLGTPHPSGFMAGGHEVYCRLSLGNLAGAV
eukprot:4631085-Prorocentrum_lima.AAC.1